jgi:hypothetical protein
MAPANSPGWEHFGMATHSPDGAWPLKGVRAVQEGLHIVVIMIPMVGTSVKWREMRCHNQIGGSEPQYLEYPNGDRGGQAAKQAVAIALNTARQGQRKCLAKMSAKPFGRRIEFFTNGAIARDEFFATVRDGDGRCLERSDRLRPLRRLSEGRLK